MAGHGQGPEDGLQDSAGNGRRRVPISFMDSTIHKTAGHKEASLWSIDSTPERSECSWSESRSDLFHLGKRSSGRSRPATSITWFGDKSELAAVKKDEAIHLRQGFGGQELAAVKKDGGASSAAAPAGEVWTTAEAQTNG